MQTAGDVNLLLVVLNEGCGLLMVDSKTLLEGLHGKGMSAWIKRKLINEPTSTLSSDRRISCSPVTYRTMRCSHHGRMQGSYVILALCLWWVELSVVSTARWLVDESNHTMMQREVPSIFFMYTCPRCDGRGENHRF